MKLARYIGIWMAVVLVAMVAGCIFTETVVVTTSLIPDAAGNALVISDGEGSSTEKLPVDLKQDATFKDYEDDIRNIESIGFYLSLQNQLFTDATFQLFLESDTSRNYTSAQGLVDSRVQLVFTDLLVPARSRVVVEWNESMKYITNLDEFTDALKSGVFDIYPTAFPRDNFNILVDSLVVIVTLTGKK